MKILSVSMMVTLIALGSMTVLWVNASVVSGFGVRSEKEKLAELDSAYQELKSQYLKTALTRVEHEARQTGFVAVVGPTYISVDTAVSFLTSSLR